MEDAMRKALRVFALIAALIVVSSPRLALAQPAPPPDPQQPSYTPGELVNAGHRFFGGVSGGLASVIERAVSRWGLPNGYVLGEEAGGAFFGGLRYGEGVLYTKNAGDLKVFWQGPTVGWDFGGEGARTMMLVYSLPATAAIYQRFAGISGSAYFIGGFGMTALTANDIVLVPIRSGVGLRLGANVGYLKFTPQSTWNPFWRTPRGFSAGRRQGKAAALTSVASAGGCSVAAPRGSACGCAAAFPNECCGAHGAQSCLWHERPRDCGLRPVIVARFWES
jgi:hypothetical protein